MRIKDAVNMVWWFGKTESPKEGKRLLVELSWRLRPVGNGLLVVTRPVSPGGRSGRRSEGTFADYSIIRGLLDEIAPNL